MVFEHAESEFDLYFSLRCILLKLYLFYLTVLQTNQYTDAAKAKMQLNRSLSKRINGKFEPELYTLLMYLTYTHILFQQLKYNHIGALA